MKGLTPAEFKTWGDFDTWAETAAWYRKDLRECEREVAALREQLNKLKKEN